MNPIQTHPFGRDIKAQDILEKMAACRGWEDKYRLIIELGKKLPPMDEKLKSKTLVISGCESKVWLVLSEHNGCYFFNADSDARIVKGLLAIILAAANGQSHAALNSFDFNAYFEQMDLLKHISQSRNNGIRAIIEKIQTIASQ